MTTDIRPFKLIETTPGKYSLLLTKFDGPAEVFEAHELDAGGYAWEGIARHVLAELELDVGLDPEASMFCAYGEDRATLEQLGAKLAALYADHGKLAAVITAVGPDGFDD